MDTASSPSTPPAEIESIGKIHFIGGIVNIITSLVAMLFYIVGGSILTVITFGLGSVTFCCLPFAIWSLVVGIMELMSGLKYKKHMENPTAVPLKLPKSLAIMQITCVLGNIVPVIMGIIVLGKLKKPGVTEYYDSQPS